LSTSSRTLPAGGDVAWAFAFAAREKSNTTTVAAMVPWRDFFGRVDPIPDAVADQDASLTNPLNTSTYVVTRQEAVSRTAR
jgi:hypothetical protein